MPPLVVIVGETASGKSALALELAQRFNGEIICADSWTVYKGFDIGTAKPSKADQQVVPHHLLDVAEPEVGFSAAVFQRLTKQAITHITARGKLPFLVGGTGLYADSILYDYSFLPPSDPALREELNALSLEAVLARADAMELDTDGIDLRNKRRVIRLIENEGVRPTKQPLRQNTLVLGIGIEREVLEQKDRLRIDTMVADGFVDEVKTLLVKYGPDIEAFKAPGYRAFLDYVQERISLDDAKLRFFQNDMQLAKKQRTWFKRNESIQWLMTEDRLAEAVELVTTLLNKTTD